MSQTNNIASRIRHAREQAQMAPLIHTTSAPYIDPMNENWIERWETGKTGWHEPDGNENLKAHWQWSGKRVLVPLCGKTPDLLWLESQGNEVVGVEVSELAVESFFEENDLEHEREAGALTRYRCTSLNLTICCGDFFEFRDEPFDAHFDRGALVALTAELRERYAQHASSLLADDARQFIVTLDYDESVCQGPPFFVSPDELSSYWPGVREHARVDDTANAPPKFLEAGLKRLDEVVWVR